jgi:hypothetical protein
MPITIATRASCCDQSARDPTIPPALNLSRASFELFRSAPISCSFTGVVHIPSGCIYLHPLVATRAGNVNLGRRQNLHFASTAGNLAGDVKSVLHPNLTPQLRAQAGLTSGHFQICQKFGLRQDDCVGFALTKDRHQHILTTSSQTLNTTKFKFLSPQDLDNLNSHKAIVVKFAQQQLVNKLGTGHMSKEWADLIARTLNSRLPPSHLTPQGNYESPF